MIRSLLTTTALALLVASPAIAQTVAAPAEPLQVHQDLLTKGYTDVDNDFLASRVVGQPVYTSAANDAEEIGDINDMVLMADGQVGAVIIGVGGFLGMGEKNVAVDVGQLQMVKAEDGTDRWVLETTKEALEAAPAFEWVEDQDAGTDIAATPIPAAPATTPADQNAMTPATDTAATTAVPVEPAPNAMTPATDTAATATPVEPNAVAVQPDATAAATDVAATPATEPNAMTGGMKTATETAATPSTAPATDVATFNREGMNALDVATITADQLIGTKVIGPENTEIAEVGDFILTEDGKIDALLVDFGGFLGIGEKRVAVGIDNLQFTTDEGGAQYVWLNVTREQLDAAAAYNQDTYANERDAQRLVVSQS